MLIYTDGMTCAYDLSKNTLVISFLQTIPKIGPNTGNQISTHQEEATSVVMNEETGKALRDLLLKIYPIEDDPPLKKSKA